MVAVVERGGFLWFYEFLFGFVAFVYFFLGPESCSMVVTLTGSLMVVPWVFLMVLSHMAKADGYMLRGFFDLHGFGLLSFILRAFHLWFRSTSLFGCSHFVKSLLVTSRLVSVAVLLSFW